MSDPVLFHAASVADAEKSSGIPASVLLALLSVEGGTNPDGSPRAPADGAGPPSYGQFTYDTGQALGVRYGDSRSEVNAIARYLKQLGYDSDPRRAVAAYNGGPANPQYGYAEKVFARRARYRAFDGGHNPVSQPPKAKADAKAGGLLSDEQNNGVVRFAIGAALVLVGVAGMGVGVARAAGVGGRVRELV